MNITRIGTVILLIGVIFFTHASASHISGYHTYSYPVNKNETLSYVILVAPVGPAQIVIGGADYRPIIGLPAGVGGSNVVANVSVHVKITDPQNNTVVEQDVITPYPVDFEFKERGSYTVSITNKDPEETSMPITVIFEMLDPKNKETDKFLVSQIIVASGAVVFLAGLVITLALKHRQKQKLT
ncbi:MAG: hypothetical protein CW716_11775 [Candidatus Bathyarchaeum sp.]|nr:MAG: hypothetical protein CW716_11775 [Candidatus Bathyarchaeum sp.]